MTQNVGHMEWYDWRYIDADCDPSVGYLEDRLEQRGKHGIPLNRNRHHDLQSHNEWIQI